MKKLVVIAVIAAMAAVSPVALASAQDHAGRMIRGTYAFTGSGHCVISTTGFDAQYQPNPGPGALVFTILQTWEGDYTFDGHGSGSLRASFHGVDLPSFAVGSLANVSWEFTYAMTDHNRFQTYLAPGTYDKVEDAAGIKPVNYYDIVGAWNGVVARNGESIHITGGPPLKHILCDPSQPPCVRTSVEAFCSESHVGIRVQDAPGPWSLR